jgi:hypothetical protein
MDVRIEPNGGIRTIVTGSEGVKAGAAVLDAHIRSQVKLKFGLYILGALFVVVAALLVVFAPDGRETVSSIIAIAMFVLAVGCAGFGTFAIKTPVISAQAGANPSNVNHSDDMHATRNAPLSPVTSSITAGAPVPVPPGAVPDRRTVRHADQP